MATGPRSYRYSFTEDAQLVRINLVRNSVPALAVAFLIACTLGCGKRVSESPVEEVRKPGAVEIDPSKVVARVDGEPISVDEVRQLIDAVDGGMDAEQALEVLIRNALLAAEAAGRGYRKHSEVVTARQRALARALLNTKIGQGVTIDSIEDQKLRRLYERQKEIFVHGVQRRVVHIVALTGEGKLSEDEALRLVEQAVERARAATSEEEFKQLGEELKKEYPEKVRVESLPPFAADSTRFAEPFVEASFVLTGIGNVSPPAKTKFGWHAIYFAEEIPPSNRSFEEVRDELAESVLSLVKQTKSDELLESIRKKGSIFIYESNLRGGGQQQ